MFGQQVSYIGLGLQLIRLSFTLVTSLCDRCRHRVMTQPLTVILLTDNAYRWFSLSSIDLLSVEVLYEITADGCIRDTSAKKTELLKKRQWRNEWWVWELLYHRCTPFKPMKAEQILKSSTRKDIRRQTASTSLLTMRLSLSFDESFMNGRRRTQIC